MLVSPVNFNPAIFFNTNHSLEMILFWKHKKCLQSYCGHSPFHYSCPENRLQKKQLFGKNTVYLSKKENKVFPFLQYQNFVFATKTNKTERFSLLFHPFLSLNASVLVAKTLQKSCKKVEKSSCAFWIQCS